MGLIRKSLAVGTVGVVRGSSKQQKVLMRWQALAAATIGLTAVSACGAAASNSAPNRTATAGAPTLTSTPRSALVNAAPTQKTLDAGGVLAALATVDPQVKVAVVYTAATDTNNLLGRPNEYTSKAAFTDSAIPASDTDGNELGDVESGGGVEVFQKASEAQARSTYLQGFAASISLLAEYDYIAGGTLLRLSHDLTPDQATAVVTEADHATGLMFREQTS